MNTNLDNPILKGRAKTRNIGEVLSFTTTVRDLRAEVLAESAATTVSLDMTVVESTDQILIVSVRPHVTIGIPVMVKCRDGAKAFEANDLPSFDRLMSVGHNGKNLLTALGVAHELRMTTAEEFRKWHSTHVHVDREQKLSQRWVVGGLTPTFNGPTQWTWNHLVAGYADPAKNGKVPLISSKGNFNTHFFDNDKRRNVVLALYKLDTKSKGSLSWSETESC